jgi:hypothetical protein
MSRSLARLCTRICARLSGFLLAIHELRFSRKNRRFPLVKSRFREMKSDVLKSLISDS